MIQSKNSSTHGTRVTVKSGSPCSSWRALAAGRTVVLTLLCLVPLVLGTSGCSEENRILQRYPSVKSGDGFPMDATGGTVKYVPENAPGVEVDLTFPAGAVPNGTAITVEESDNFPLDPDIDMIPELVFKFGPDGIVFGAPVELTITYDPALLGGIDPKEIRIFKTVGGLWEALDTTLDETAHTFSAMMPGFSDGGPGRARDQSPPETIADPDGGSYAGCLDVYLICEDDDGDEHGCKETYYKTIVETEPPAYIKYNYGSPITLAGDTTLRFYSEDWYYNRSGTIDKEYIVSGCGNNRPANTTPSNFINGGEASTSSLELSLAISATDDIGVTAYLVKSDSAEAPDADDPDWVATISTTSFSDTISYIHPDASEGVKTVYVFFKDGSDLVSTVRSDTITYTTGGGPAFDHFIDFATMADGRTWGGGGPISDQYSEWGVLFDWTLTGMVGGGRGLPWVQYGLGGGQVFHSLTNDKNSSGKLLGIIHIIFTVNPSDVSFRLWFPSAVGDTMRVDVFGADGQQLPASAIGWADSELHGYDITISWPAGIKRINLHAAYFAVGVDDLRFSGGEE